VLIEKCPIEFIKRDEPPDKIIGNYLEWILERKMESMFFDDVRFSTK